MVAGYKRAADIARSSLGLVHGREDGEATDTETSDPAADRDLVPDGCGGDLHDDTDAEDDVPEDDGVFATELVGDGGGDESAEEGTDGQLS